MITFLFIDSERVWRGGQDQLLTLLPGLIQHGHEVHLICYPRTLLEKRARAAGVHVHPMTFGKLAGASVFLRLLFIMRRVRPDIVAFNTPRPIFLGSLASRLTSVRARMIFRRVNFPLRRNPATRLKYNWGIDCIVAISESIKYQLQAGGIPASRIHTVYEGIDLALYPARQQPIQRQPCEPKIIGTVAHLSEEKGHFYLVEAAALIRDVQSRMRFVIVGEGKCRPALEEQVRARGLTKCFYFAGFQTAPSEYYRQFDLFVLPSLSEGLSSSILTAMAMALPVIATDVGGIPELIQHEDNGLLVPAANPGALAEAINRLADDPETAFQMGQRSRKRMEAQFTLERKIAETEQLCVSLVQDSTPVRGRPMRDLIMKYFPEARENHLQRATFLTLAASISLVLVSIAASQILLAGAVLASAFLLMKSDGTCWHWPPFILPLAGFFLWTVTAALLSPAPAIGMGIVKKFFLFLILFLVPLVLRGKHRVLSVYHAIFAVAFVSASWGAFQYLANPHRDLVHRISGWMSQWMTYSGLLMLVLVALSAYIMCIGLGRAAWAVPLGLMLIAALALSLTRNAWLGAIAGLAAVFVLVRPRALGGLILIVLLMLLISPGKIQDRLRTGLDLTDANTRNRIELFETSLRLIKDNPWFGVGPKNVGKEALRYRGTNEFPDWMYQHMHNNFLQIAAERGLPGLVLWFWFIGRLIWDAWRVRCAASRTSALKAAGPEPNEALYASTAALGCCVALLVAGLFEYNFGDSEVLALFLFIMSAPYAFLNKATADFGKHD